MDDYKIVMLGEGAVGKSTLTISFITGRTQTAATAHHSDLRLSNMFDYDPTIEESFTTSRNVDSQVAHMSILDTAGQEELAISMRDQWIRASDGFVLVFSLTSMESFKHLSSIFQHIQRTKEEEYLPMVLVGNKCDLPRQVSEEEASKLAQLWRCKYFECSATMGTNITEPYHQVVREMRKFYCIGDSAASASISSSSSSIYNSWRTRSRKNSNSKSKTTASRSQGKASGRKNSLSKESGGHKTSKHHESKKSKWMCNIL